MIKEIALQIAFKLLGKPYIWGGDDIINGFDCSGFVIEVLKSVGILPRKGDWTAHDLSNKFKKVQKFEPGNLVFWDWNNDGRIDHVEMIFDITETGTVLTIGASDGGPKTLTPKNAEDQNAYIKIRPIREGFCAIVNPFQ